MPPSVNFYIDSETYIALTSAFFADSLLEQVWDFLYGVNLDYEEPWAIYNSSTITWEKCPSESFSKVMIY